MLTRSEVAQRLGKSIATVRRLEGVELHPRRDRRGTWLFTEAEVDKLRRRMAGGFRAPVGLGGVVGAGRQGRAIEALERRITVLEDLLAEALTGR